jgi:energy-converting hydrogenase Eha subunit A
MSIETVLLTNITDELATIAVGCQKFGLVCTEQAEFDKYTIVIGLIGMVIGALSVLLSQYLRKRKEK